MASPVKAVTILTVFCAINMQIKYRKDTLFDLSSPLYTVAPSTFSNLVIFNLLTKPPNAATVPFLDVSTVHSRATSMHEPPRKFAYTFFRVSLLFSIVKQRKLAVSYDIVLNKPISLSLSCVWSY